MQLVCIARENKPINNPNHKKPFTEKAAIELTAKGRYPILKIVDIRNDHMSVATLWENFKINKINKELCSALSSQERNFNSIEKLNYSDAKDLQNNLSRFEWDFGYLQNKHPIRPRKIVLTMENIGGTDLEWKFK